MPRITEDCVARIKESADIVELVGRYLQLRRSGYSWKACCPFHNEKTPSFHVNPARQSFHCFGCGAGGDAVKFLMMYENLDYPTALRRLADMNGVPVIEEEDDPELERKRRLRSRIIELNELAAAYFHSLLCRDQDASHVRQYLQSRAINIDIAKAWQLGWAPPNFKPLRDLADSRGFDAKLLTEAYLLGQGSEGVYPVFRDRLMFPIRNIRGEVVGFSGRVMQADKDPRKYVNTAETLAFRKGSLLFGLYKATAAIAKNGMSAVICEGQLDVIACHEKADVRNAVAGLGTAFTEEHARMLAKYARKATLCYDGDKAGIAASEKTYRKLAQAGLEVYWATLPSGEDPDSLITGSGPDALRDAIAAARPYLEVRVGRELIAAEGDANARAALVPRMADLASEISDNVRRDIAVADLATRLNVGLDSFRSLVTQILRDRKNSPTVSLSRRQDEPDDSDADEVPESGQDAERAARPSSKVIPIQLHPTLRGLICMALSNRAAQDKLVDCIEELQEPIRTLSGGVLLQRVLEVLPEPGNSDARDSLADTLPPEQGAALRLIPLENFPEEGLDAYIADACARAAKDSILARIDSLRARIRDPQLSREDLLQCMKEMEKLQKLAVTQQEPL